MKREGDHTVLIVDDEEPIGKLIAKVLKKMGLKSVYAPDGEKGILEIKKAESPFSIVLSDQVMPGMKGHEFLEIVSKITPHTVRFLMSGYSDMNIIIDAVNKGSIDRYLSKPWKSDVFRKAIELGLKHYELIADNKRLFKIAKEQNTKLYRLNQELKKKVDNRKKSLDVIDQKIQEYKNKIDIEKDEKQQQAKKLNYIKQSLKERNLMDQRAFDGFARNTVVELREQFQNIAIRHGFEMPEKIR